MHNDPHVKPEQIPVSRASGGTLSLHSRQGIHEVGYRSPHTGQGTVSPIAVTPHHADPTRPRGS